MESSAERPVIDQLVVPVSGEPGDAVALSHAAAFARRADLPVTLLRQVPAGASTRGPREDAELLASRQRGVEVAVRIVEAERPADAIIELLDRRPGAVVCMSTGAPSPAGQLLFGSVAVEVARRSPAPLVVTGPHAVASHRGTPIERIEVCLDGSSAAERSLGVAEVFASTLGLTIEVCQVVAPPGPDGPQFECGYLVTAAERLGGDRPPAWRVVHGGTPAGGLATLVHDRPGTMLAVATHARRIGERFREGSVTVDLLRQVRTPVLVIGPGCRWAQDEGPGHPDS